VNSPANDSFYVRSGDNQVLARPTTASPWGPQAQHGGPPTALLARAIQRLEGGEERVLGRLTVELLGPVPVGHLSVEASITRPGRSVDLCEATLYDDERGRPVAKAAAWRFPSGVSGAGRQPEPLPHTSRDGEQHERPRSWSGGYLDAVEWRWVKGSVEEQGPAVVWMRPGIPLLDDEDTTPLQMLMACADSASGASAALDPAEWAFLNTELTVHLLREPVGEWFCLDAVTTLGTGSIGLATSSVYDERGLVARTAQALLTLRR
jgi:Thioesterase-like superfamily